METQTITLDREIALEKFREYKKHLHYSTPVDHEIRRTYQHIARGRVVIRALDSIVKAGLNEQKLPKLAVVRADMPLCRFRASRDGSATFFGLQKDASQWASAPKSQSLTFPFPEGSFPGAADGRYAYEAIVPIIPIDKRPKRGLANYHILFEAEWSRKVPIDPMLLRRIGKGDMWLVVAAWDLTPVEQAALAARI